MSENVMTGKIRRLITPRGFGFIEAGEGKDLFFHHSSLKDVEFEDLKEGDLVAFAIAKGRKGDEAVKVERLDGKGKVVSEKKRPGKKKS